MNDPKFYYTTNQAADLLKVTRQTVANWAGEFADYLNILANPGANEHRRFTIEDMRVLALIAEMKAVRMTYEVIHASLQSGQRGDFEPPDLAEAAQAALVKRSPEIQVYEKQITVLREENTRLQSEMAELRGKHHGQVELLQQQLDAAQQQIVQLNRKIWELEAGQGD